MKRIFLILCLITICNISYADIASVGYVDSVVATKQDTISDIETIRTGAAAGATAVQPSSLSTVAKTGSYNDLTNKPTIPTVPRNISSFTNDSGYITNTATWEKSIAIGEEAEVTYKRSVAIGDGAYAGAGAVTAVGAGSRASGASSIVIGADAQALEDETIVIGTGASTIGMNSLTIGHNAYTDDRSAIAIGNDTKAFGEYSMAIRGMAWNHSLAINGNSDGYGAIAISGNDEAAGAYEFGATAVGNAAYAEGEKATTIGSYAGTYADYATAIGGEANADAEHAIQLGSGYNSTPRTFNVGFGGDDNNYTLLESDGTIPYERFAPVPPDSCKASVGKKCALVVTWDGSKYSPSWVAF